MCFSHTEKQLGIHLQTVRKSVFLWVETEVLLLQKKESDRQHKLASPSAASLLRILVLLEITVVIFFKEHSLPQKWVALFASCTLAQGKCWVSCLGFSLFDDSQP